ncbi:PH domain-containing protein [Paenibacillus sp. P96]|uniref:PH domain-containing protein n=1 Tax=Paenibacillus zeirhizosphaerae TaxID=2987519 RepID=A0ABT9FUW4_9BACL|nr:PH domain-containing protein [Paenibacillus sp. P96]MDP4098527.1 PH domain-containing protein [Paenibacillus sp. P96]
MFKRAAAEMLGLSDIGSVIRREDYDKVDADDYVMHEDNERIYFLIKSKMDEYCFTNHALIHLDGTTALSKKRVLARYPYAYYPVREVLMETAGTVDLDVEIKFKLGEHPFSIDVHKKFITEIKDLYKSLLKIAEITHENNVKLTQAQQSQELASSVLGQTNKLDANLLEQFNGIRQSAFEWMTESHKQYKRKDFGAVFERYINN